MLSRTAENLYWTGRYVERAENTARALDVTRSHLYNLINDLELKRRGGGNDFS